MVHSAPRTAGAPSELLRRTARDRPDALALVDSAAGGAAARLSWADLDRRVNGAAAALRRAGLDTGDRVVLQLPTGADFAVLYLGALRGGLVPVPANPSYSQAEIEHIRTDSQAAAYLDAGAGRALLERAAPAPDPELDRTGEQLAVLLYTSGTSGRGRGVMLSARALAANLDQIAAVRPRLLSDADVLFVPLPLTHIFGLNAGLGAALRVGATLVVADRFDAGATLRTMAAEHVTAVVGVPGQYAAWLAHPAVGEGFAAVRFAMSGSATLARGVVDGFAAAGIALHDGYGLTEAAPVVCVDALGPGGPAIGSVGRPLPGVEVELRDADREVVTDGDPGRVYIRGENLFSGYWPDGADGPDAQGWFAADDVAVADADGRLHLVGRTSDVVIVNGFNVHPAEIEAVLARVPGVAEVAVTGVPDATTGEATQAYVVPARGADLHPGELLEAASRSLARFKLPRSVEVVSSLPHTVTGKIMKWQLGRSASDGTS